MVNRPNNASNVANFAVTEQVSRLLVLMLSRLAHYPALHFWKKIAPVAVRAGVALDTDEREGLEKVIYTYITNRYDSLKEPGVCNRDWRYICYSDTGQDSAVWDVQDIDTKWQQGLSSKQIASLLKIEHYNFAPGDSDLVITIDGSMQIIADLNDVVDALWEDGLDMVIARHPKRDCVYQEAVAVLEKGFDTPSSVSPQVWRYFLEGYPASNGMYGTRMMIKNNRSANLRRMCEIWSQEYRRGSCRDQLSLNYAIWKARREGLAINIKEVDFDWLYKDSGMFGIRRHNG